MHPRLNNTWYRLAYESDSQPWQHTLKSEDPVQFLHLQKLRVGASGALTRSVLAQRVLCSENTFTTGNLWSPREKKLCLCPKNEEYVTLHGTCRGKNNYSYSERNFKSCKFYTAVHMPTEKSSPGRAPQGNFRGGLCTKGPEQRDLLRVNNEDKPLSENYMLAPGKLFQTKATE